MLLHKIIPDEFVAFSKLRFTPVQEHIPEWRESLSRTPKTPVYKATPPSEEVQEPPSKAPCSHPPYEPPDYTIGAG